MSFEKLVLTDSQKESILYALYQIARSDNQLADTEISFLSSVADSFGKVFNHLSVQKLITKNSAEHFKMLCTLNEAQKEFFVIAAYSMINNDKRLLDEEFSLTNQFFRAMGIGYEKAIGIISKVDEKVNYY